MYRDIGMQESRFRLVLGTLIIALLLGMLFPAPVLATDPPSTVLVLVNDAYLPETGTGGVGASDYVGEHYATARNIPAGNILHLNIPYLSYQSDGKLHGMEYDANQFISYADYVTYIQTPVQNYLSQNPNILYIVPTYGVPVMLADSSDWRVSIDSVLAGMYYNTARNIVPSSTSPDLQNPYTDPSVAGTPQHFSQWRSNQSGPKMYLVTRLDGPSAVIAAGLVNKAIAAEASTTAYTGTAYFDWENTPSSSDSYPLDQTMLSGYDTAVSMRIPALLNNQSVTGNFIQSGPNASWVWGWYDPAIINSYSSPVTGAIAAQATSYTCNSIRDGGAVGDSNWCVYFLNNGFTGTWGATGEALSIYADGNYLFGHFWRGYNFAESSYLSDASLNWMMVFIGDPLYTLPDTVVAPLPTGWFNIVSKYSHSCIGVTGGPSVTSPAQLDQYTCGAGADQQFQLTSVNPSGIAGDEITIKSSGLQFDVNGGPQAQGDGVGVGQYPYWGGANEVWEVTQPDSSGYVTIRAASSGKCLTVPGPTTANGAPVQQSACNGSDNQKWSLPTVGSNSDISSYVKTDTTTLGQWETSYGADGYYIPDSISSNPSYATFSLSGGGPYLTTTTSTDPRALVLPGGGTIVSNYSSTSKFTININVTDGNTHQVALYMQDFDNSARNETIQLLDANNNLLDTRTVTPGTGGDYLVYNVSGNVHFVVTNNNPNTNAALFGMFFGGPRIVPAYVKTDTTTLGNWESSYGADGYYIPDSISSNPSYASYSLSGGGPYLTTTTSTDPRALVLPGGGTVVSNYSSTSKFTINIKVTDGNLHQVALYMLDFNNSARNETVQMLDANNDVLDTRTVTPGTGGDYLVYNVGGNVHFVVTNNNPNTNAALFGMFFGGPKASTGFVKTDTATQGNWPLAYGADGYSIAGSVSQNPSYAVLSVTGAGPYTWAAVTTDRRALFVPPPSAGSIAAAWSTAPSLTTTSPVGGPNIGIEINITDGGIHQVALYLLDWDAFGGGRNETVQLINNITNTVIDTRTVSSFGNGEYLVYNVGGDVRFQIANNNANSNAVLSGVFFGK